ncbi:MAG: DUF4825 domain-containing protein [Bacilli bacterium]|uniref:DUF4825 domain-containing protein n=1 Tax=Paraclostridium sp. TaxID=2023273 RepID=UPI003AA083D8
MIKFIIPLMLSFLFLVGCESIDNASIFNDISNMSEVKLCNLIEFDNSYVGDNSAVGNIIYNLPGNNFNEGFSLKTDKKPYEINIKYDFNSYEDLNSKDFSKKNALVMFSLVENAHVINFNINENVYTYTKSDIEKWYGSDFDKILNDIQSWKEFATS